MTTRAKAKSRVHDAHTIASSAAHLEALGWAFTHPPTQEAYRRSTGEDIAPALHRYQQWLEANIIGDPGGIADDEERAA